MRLSSRRLPDTRVRIGIHYKSRRTQYLLTRICGIPLNPISHFGLLEDPQELNDTITSCVLSSMMKLGKQSKQTVKSKQTPYLEAR